MKSHIALYLVLFLLLAACNGNQTAIPTSQPRGNQTPIRATRTFTSSQTPTLTITRSPTSILLPQTFAPTTIPHALALSAQNVQNLVQLAQFGRSYPRKVVWVPNSDVLAVVDDSIVSLLDPTTLDTLNTLDPDTSYPLIATSAQGQYLFVASSTVEIWDVKTGQPIKTLGYIAGGIRDMAVSANGRVLAIAGPATPGGGDPDYKSQIIEIESGKEVYSVQQYGGIGAIAIDALGRLVVSRTERGMETFDARSGALLHTFPIVFAEMALATDGSLLFGDGTTSTPIEIWNAKSGELQTTIEDGFGKPMFSLDGKWLILWTTDGKIQIRDAMTYRLAQSFDIKGVEISELALSPDNKSLAGITDDGISVWEVASGQVEASLSEFTSSMEMVGFSPDSNTIFGGSNYKPYNFAWDIASGVMLTAPVEFQHPANINIESPDGRLRTEEWIDTEPNPPIGAIRLIDTQSNEIHFELVGHKVIYGEGFTGLVQNLVFNWDGSLLASAGYDDYIRLWNVNSGELLLELPPQTLLTDINFSPDGRYLASSSHDGTIRLWGIPTP